MSGYFQGLYKSKGTVEITFHVLDPVETFH
jgi:hypothetical protein